MARFMTPDWAEKPITVPYGKFGDPQTLNLYSYVENAPVNRADEDGHSAAGSTACGVGEEPACTGQPIIPRRFDPNWRRCICAAAPTDANGDALPPPVPVPGAPDRKWKWNKNDQNKRKGSWGPDTPIPGQSQPSASWEDRAGQNGTDHWDVDDGKGGRERYDKDGNPLTPQQAHGQSMTDKLKDVGQAAVQTIKDHPEAAGAAVIIIITTAVAPELDPIVVPAVSPAFQ